MFKRILVAYDGSESAQAVLRIGIGLARGRDAALSSISVEEHLPRYAASISEIAGAKEQIDEHFRTLTKRARDLALLEGVDLEAVVRQGHEVGEIVDFTREGRFDLLILGAHGHSRVFEWIIGSTSLSVARVAPCSVLVARVREGTGEGLDAIKQIVVGLDGSPLGRLALRAALDLATLCGASVVGVTVREISVLARPQTTDTPLTRQLGLAASEHARAVGVVFEHVVTAGHAAQALREQARQHAAGLLVLGATGLEHPWSATIGGTAGRVISEAPCSVLLVRSSHAILHVTDVMARGVSAVKVDTPLADVVELLLRRDVKSLPVLDTRRRVSGIITGGDLLTRGDVGLRLSLNKDLDTPALIDLMTTLNRSTKTARDVMTRHVYTIDPGADLASVVRLMTAHRVKRLPVVNADKELVGIVSRADVLRAIAALPEPAEQQALRALPGVARTVGDATIAGVPIVAPDASAEAVLEKVLASPLRRVVVVDESGKVLGLISDRDLMLRTAPAHRSRLLKLFRGQRSASAEKQPMAAPDGGLTADALMGPVLITVHADDSIGHAIRLMMQHGVKRLIVVDANGRLRGLVDRREILRLLAEWPAPR